MDDNTLRALRNMALVRAKAEIDSIGHAMYNDGSIEKYDKIEKLSKEFFDKIEDLIQ